MSETEVEVKESARRFPRRAIIGLVGAVAVVTAIGGAFVLTNRDVTPTPRAELGELDYLIGISDAEQSQREQELVQMPTIGTERVTIQNHTPLPSLIVMTGDDACWNAGGVRLNVSPPQCSVDIKNALGTSR